MVGYKHYAEPPVDEVLLQQKARQVLSSFVTFNKESLQEVADAHGVELATMVLYLYLSESRCGDFISELDALPPQAEKFSSPPKILVVPGLSFKEHPEMGGDGVLIKEIGTLFGNDVEIVDIKSKGSVSENSAIVQEALLKEQASRVWIVSLSKGTAEVRKFFQDNADAVPHNIVGWVDLSGVFSGTPLADVKLNSFVKRVFYKGMCRAFSTSYAGLDELRTKHEFWESAFKVEQNIEILHIVGIPLLSHMNGHIISKYRQLCAFGPNDGIIALSDVLDYPGKIYPVWGGDHMMRVQGLSALWYKIFHYVNLYTKED